MTRAGAARIDWLAIAMGVAFALMWSSAFSSARIALQSAPPVWMLVARFALAGAISVSVAWLLGQRLPIARAHWWRIAILGVCQNSLYLGLYFMAMVTVPAGIAAIIASCMPLLVAVGGAWLFRERLPGRAVLGLAIGFAGVAWIMAGRMGGDLDAHGLALCVVGVAALSVATLMVRHAEFGSGLLMVVGLQMLIGGLALLPFAIVLEPHPVVAWRASLLLAFAYMTLVPGIMATVLWFALVRRIGAPRASAFHFLNPVFGVAVASVLLGEALGIGEVGAVLVVTVGIALVQWPRRPVTT